LPGFVDRRPIKDGELSQNLVRCQHQAALAGS